MQLPDYPADRPPAERAALLDGYAQQMAEQVIRESGPASHSVDRLAVIEEAKAMLTMRWLQQRVEALEAAAHPRTRKARNGEAIK